jgi:predicted phosphodiesterase
VEFSAQYRKAYGDIHLVGDLELVDASIDAQRKLQKARDLARVERKSFREHSRLINTLEEAGSYIQRILETYDLSEITVEHEDLGLPTQGIIQLSDLHFNELVQTAVNTYDFEIAAKRLKLFAVKATEILLMKKVKSVLVVNTGDTLNSDRRLDEYMSMATNRMNASMLAVYLLEQFLVDLNVNFNVTYIQVSGNESRVKDEPGYTDVILTDNHDMLIYNIMKHGMRTAKGIQFIDGDPSERVVSIFGKNVLIAHGEEFSDNALTASIQKTKGKYAQHGVLIDFVIFGHVHAAMVHDQWARGSSLVGENTYSDRGLQVTSRASQNVHVYYSNGEHDSYVVGLQNTDGIKGYGIIPELEAYNAKSEKKLRPHIVIHQVTV